MSRYCVDGARHRLARRSHRLRALAAARRVRARDLTHRLCRGQRRKRRLDGLEIADVRAIGDRQQLRFAVDVLRPVPRVRMAAQPLRRAAAASRLAFDRLEHAREVARVVARARHDLGAQEIRLFLEVAAVLQEERAKPELAALGDRRARGAAHRGAADRPGNLAKLQPGILRFRCIGRPMPQQHVRQLVRHDAGDLAFSCSGVEHAAVHEHRTAGQREGIDLFQVHRRERVLVDRLL